jgi:type I restriction enzyme M protein
VKDGNKNRLRHQDIHKIVDVFNRQVETAKYARMVALAEIEANDYNLNIPRYIDSTEVEDQQDIEAHLRGGIPNRDIEALAPYWQVCPSLNGELFTSGPRPGYSTLTVETAAIKPTIFAHPEFATFTRSVEVLFDDWRSRTISTLKGLAVGCHPKQLIESIAENLLATFGTVHLVDQYDVYQHLMTYWTETMQDDVYLIAADGWQASRDLIPSELVVARYFGAEQQAIEKLEGEKDAISRRMEELDEEHGGEEGLLAEAKTDKGKLTKASIKARLAEVKHDRDAAEELKLLSDYLELIEQEAAANKKVKDAQKALEAKVTAKYRVLTEAEVKVLVVDDKWLATLAADVKTELDRVSQALAGRIRELAERYAAPLPELTVTVETLASRVDEHLQQMGFVWN